MLEPLPRWYPFKKHPILDGIREYIRSDHNDAIINNFLTENMVFLYPRIISISLIRYPKLFTSFESISNKESDFKANLETESDIINNFYMDKILSSLKSYCQKKSFMPIILIDLRFSSIFYSSIVDTLVQYFGSDTSNVVVLASSGLKSKIDVFKNKVNIFYATETLFLYILDLITRKENVLLLDLPRKVTIASFGEVLKNVAFYKNVGKYFVVSFDFSNTSHIDTFLLCLLNIFIRSSSPIFGLNWRIEDTNINNNIMDKIWDFRVLTINSFFFVGELKVSKKKIKKIKYRDLNIRRFGIFMFNVRTRRIFLDAFDGFMGSLVEMFRSYMEEYVTVTWDAPDRSYKPSKHSLKRYAFINIIVKELIENVTMHAKSPGYFAAEIDNYVLNIFIGDCGVGLKSGIINNYNYDKDICTAQGAINHVFNLDPEKRKDKIRFTDAGYGLSDSLKYLRALKGKMLFRTEDCFGSFMNPITISKEPSRVFKSHSYIAGTQYMIQIPLSEKAISNIYSTTKKFLEADTEVV